MRASLIVLFSSKKESNNLTRELSRACVSEPRLASTSTSMIGKKAAFDPLQFILRAPFVDSDTRLARQSEIRRSFRHQPFPRDEEISSPVSKEAPAFPHVARIGPRIA